eukprot:624924-Rhodomonas_salina.2
MTPASQRSLIATPASQRSLIAAPASQRSLIATRASAQHRQPRAWGGQAARMPGGRGASSTRGARKRRKRRARDTSARGEIKRLWSQRRA